MVEYGYYYGYQDLEMQIEFRIPKKFMKKVKLSFCSPDLSQHCRTKVFRIYAANMALHYYFHFSG